MQVTCLIVGWGPCENPRWGHIVDEPQRVRIICPDDEHRKNLPVNGRPCRGRLELPGPRRRPLRLGLVSRGHPGGMRPSSTGVQVFSGHDTERGVPSNGKILSSRSQPRALAWAGTGSTSVRLRCPPPSLPACLRAACFRGTPSPPAQVHSRWLLRPFQTTYGNESAVDLQNKQRLCLASGLRWSVTNAVFAQPSAADSMDSLCSFTPLFVCWFVLNMSCFHLPKHAYTLDTI